MVDFSVRDFDSIFTDLALYFQGANQVVTDLTEGSVIRTLLETVADEAARQSYGTLVAINEAQEIAAFTTFGFDPLPAARAYGEVLFTPTSPLTADLTLPAGSTVSLAGSASFRFELVAGLTLPAGASPTLAVVRAILPGTTFNVVSGVLDTIDAGFAGLSVTNPRPFITGLDAETDAQRRERFAVFLTGLHRATYNAIVYGVKTATIQDANGYTIERVLKANSIEQGAGIINVYIDNGVDGASAALLAQAARVITGYRDAGGVSHEGWKAAGIKLGTPPDVNTVYQALRVRIPVQFVLEAAAGREPGVVQSEVISTVDSYFRTLDVGDTVRVEQLKNAVLRTPGVLDITSWSSPLQNITTPATQLAVLGALTVAVY